MSAESKRKIPVRLLVAVLDHISEDLSVDYASIDLIIPGLDPDRYGYKISIHDGSLVVREINGGVET